MPDPIPAWQPVADAACPTVERIFAANRDHALALCLEATERGDHALAQWIADRLTDADKKRGQE